MQFIIASTLKTAVWDSPSSHVISLELLHGSAFTATGMALLLAGVHTVFGKPEFTGVVVVGHFLLYGDTTVIVET
jgi:hypothetical protein